MNTYLFVWSHGSARQVNDEPTMYDLVAAKQQFLSIFTFRNGAFCRLRFNEDDSGTLHQEWVPVAKAKSLKAEGLGGFHC